jgi:hypothetical protein
MRPTNDGQIGNVGKKQLDALKAEADELLQ